MLLDRRTFDGAIGAKHAAIAFLGFQQSPARLAIIEKLAGIGRHGFCFGMTAVRTRNGRFENYSTHFFSALTEDGYPAFFVASVN